MPQSASPLANSMLPRTVALLLFTYPSLNCAFRRVVSLSSHEQKLATGISLEMSPSQKAVTDLGLIKEVPDGAKNYVVKLLALWSVSMLTYGIVAAVVVSVALRMFGQSSRDCKGGKAIDKPSSEVDSDVFAADSTDSDDAISASHTYSWGTIQSLNGLQTSALSSKSRREKRLRRAFKTHWLRESHAEHLSSSAKWLGTLMLGFLSLRFLKFFIHPLDYHGHNLAMGIHFSEVLLAIEVMALTIVVAMAYICYRYPHDSYYWPLFLFYCFYVIAQGLPPVEMSCQGLMEYKVQNGDWYMAEVKTAHDCSLQGISTQHLFMAAILMLPWLVPRVKMLARLSWAWIVLFALWSIAYMNIMGERILTIPENLTRLLIFCIAMGIACFKKYYLEKSQRNKFVHHLQHKHATKKMFNYFQYMVPEHVIVPMIKNPNVAIADNMDRVSILFVVISDFDQFAQKSSPHDLLKFLNENFSHFDRICEEQGVTKIETVGEEYVACVGVVPSDVEIHNQKGHDEILKKLFFAADRILKSQSTKVKFKMGMHTGPVKAGVIGRKLPRFRLFGDTINTAARMMQKSITGKLQFGEETFKDLPSSVLAKARGEIEMKGKGLVQTYFLDGIAIKDQLTAKEHQHIGHVRKPRKSIFQMGCADAQFSVAKIPSDEDEAVLDQEAEEIVRNHLDSDSSANMVEENSTFQVNTVATTAHRKQTDFDDVLTRTSMPEIVVPEKESAYMRLAALIQRKTFNPEMEEAWYLDYHQNSICKKLDTRLNRYMFWFTVLTLLEIIYMTSQRSYSSYRMPMFIGYRSIPFLVMLIWRFAIIKTEWLGRNPFQAQTCILLSACFISFVHFFSYDFITGSKEKVQSDWVSKWTRDDSSKDHRDVTFDQIFSLNYVLFFYLSTGQQNILERPSLAFVGLACILLAISQRRPELGLVFQFLPKVLFVALTTTNCILAREAEQSSRTRFRSQDQVEKTKHRIEGILNTLMPPLVVDELRKISSNATPPSHQYHFATIAQSDLCGFTKLASTRTPTEVVEFMSELFGYFDELTDDFGVYKVETVGDAYIAGMAEAPLTTTNSPEKVIRFGLAMVEAVNAWAGKMGVSVKCRVGVHHGACIGGIVGQDMQRYHLFGNLMTGLEVLESTAPEGLVQISQAAKDAVDKEVEDVGLKLDFSFEKRSAQQLQTSKGEIHEYEEVGGRTYIIYPGGA